MQITIVKPGHTITTPIDIIKGMPNLIEKCGRTCYKSEDRMTDESADRFVRMIVKSGHHSVLEHMQITVNIIGDRSMSHQLVRHRIAAYSQESQRYCDYGKLGFQVICPPKISNDVDVIGIWEYDEKFDSWSADSTVSDYEKFEIWLTSVKNSYQDYLKLRESGIPAEDARSVLPNATKTEVQTTFNLSQWRHVFEHRALNHRAQWQIREIMLGILKEFKVLLPCVFDDLMEK